MLAELARSYDVSRSTISSLRHRDSTRAKVHDLGRYLELIVEPTFDEFKKNRASVRHAFLTCVAIYHAIDRVSYPNKPGNLRKEWGKQSLEFKLVDIIAHHFKHVHSSDEIIGIRRPGLPISRALGFNDAGDQMDLRNLFFVIRDAMKFLHQQAGLTIAPIAPTPAVRGSQQSLAVEMSPATLLPEKLAAFRDLVEVAKTDPT